MVINEMSIINPIKLYALSMSTYWFSYRQNE